jgi:hypothetical protein
MWVDILILAFCISAIYRGREIGFVRQACSTIGFFGGLFLGAWLQSYTVKLANTPSGRAVITLITTVGCATRSIKTNQYDRCATRRRNQHHYRTHQQLAASLTA